MNLTEDGITTFLPMTKEWDPGLRARLVEGLERLNGCTCPEPDLAALIAMVVICCEDHEPSVRIIRKPDCAERARANDVGEETIAAILSPAFPGHLDVFVYAARHELVFSLPLGEEAVFEFIGTRH